MSMPPYVPGPASAVAMFPRRGFAPDVAHEEMRARAAERALGTRIDAEARARAAGDAPKYEKPQGGIPRSDMDDGVRASLAKADSALQPADVANKADLVGGKVPADQLPSYVDDVLEYASAAQFPAEGEGGKIYVAKDTDRTYRWSGTQYTEIANPDSFKRQYILVAGAESDEQMPTLMDFEEGRIVYDSGDDEQMPTAQELLGGDMVVELYMAGENRQGIEIYHDGIVIVKPYGGEMQVYEYSVVISDIMAVQTTLAKIYAAVQGDSEKPILIVELS